MKIDELIKLEEIIFGYKQINKLLPKRLQHIVDHDSKGLTLSKNTLTTLEIKEYQIAQTVITISIETAS